MQWVNDNLDAFEDFLGFYRVPDISANTIVSLIKAACIRLTLSLDKCLGQPYNGTSNMLGKNSGVAKQICDIQPRAHPTHCHAHSLNLCVKDMTVNSKVMEDALDIAREIVLLIKFSPKQESILSNIKENLEMEDDEYEQPAGIAKLSKTRWTVRAICFERILKNYDEIMELWRVTLKQGKLESEVKSRIIGCQCQMETFSLFFGLCLGKNLYKHSDNLSKPLQSVKMCALSSFNTAMLTVQVLGHVF